MVFSHPDTMRRGIQRLVGLGFLLVSMFSPQSVLAWNKDTVHEKLERPDGVYERTVEKDADGFLSEVLHEKFYDPNGSMERTVSRALSSDEAELSPIDQEGRFVHLIEKDLAMAYVGLGILPVGIALLWIGYRFDRFKGRGNAFTMFGFFFTLAGLAIVFVAGQGSRTEISRAAGTVKQQNCWYGLRWGHDYSLDQFDHILVNRKIIRNNSKSGRMSDTKVSYGVRLSGKEDLHVTSFEWAFDARGFARKLSDYAGLPVTENL